jgi:hypothetical protein
MESATLERGAGVISLINQFSLINKKTGGDDPPASDCIAKQPGMMTQPKDRYFSIAAKCTFWL